MWSSRDGKDAAMVYKMNDASSQYASGVGLAPGKLAGAGLLDRFYNVCAAGSQSDTVGNLPLVRLQELLGSESDALSRIHVIKASTLSELHESVMLLSDPAFLPNVVHA